MQPMKPRGQQQQSITQMEKPNPSLGGFVSGFGRTVVTVAVGCIVYTAVGPTSVVTVAVGCIVYTAVGPTSGHEFNIM